MTYKKNYLNTLCIKVCTKTVGTPAENFLSFKTYYFNQKMDFWRYIKRAHDDLKALTGHLERSTYGTVKNFSTGVFNCKKRTITITLLMYSTYIDSDQRMGP